MGYRQSLARRRQGIMSEVAFMMIGVLLPKAVM
jgi:hypothetical protein